MATFVASLNSDHLGTLTIMLDLTIGRFDDGRTMPRSMIEASSDRSYLVQLPSIILEYTRRPVESTRSSVDWPSIIISLVLVTKFLIISRITLRLPFQSISSSVRCGWTRPEATTRSSGHAAGYPVIGADQLQQPWRRLTRLDGCSTSSRGRCPGRLYSISRRPGRADSAPADCARCGVWWTGCSGDSPQALQPSSLQTPPARLPSTRRPVRSDQQRSCQRIVEARPAERGRLRVCRGAADRCPQNSSPSGSYPGRRGLPRSRWASPESACPDGRGCCRAGACLLDSC